MKDLKSSVRFSCGLLPNVCKNTKVSWIFQVKPKSMQSTITHGKSEFSGKVENTNILKLLVSWTFLDGWSRNQCNALNIQKVNSHISRKVWRNTNNPKLWFLWIFLQRQKYIQSLSYRTSGFPFYNKSMGRYYFQMWQNIQKWTK